VTRNIPTSTTPDPAVVAFQQGLRDLGYVEGKTFWSSIAMLEEQVRTVSKTSWPKLCN
jgi:hypothetical protein